MYKNSSFLSFISLLLLVKNTGEVIEQTWQSVTQVEWNEMKNAIMQVTFFWMVSWLICRFIIVFLYTKRKRLLKRNLATILHPWSPDCLEKFCVLMLLIKLSKCWKLFNFPKISIKMKMKNFKTFFKPQTTSPLNEIIKPPHYIKVS